MHIICHSGLFPWTKAWGAPSGLPERISECSKEGVPAYASSSPSFDTRNLMNVLAHNHGYLEVMTALKLKAAIHQCYFIAFPAKNKECIRPSDNFVTYSHQVSFSSFLELI